jgi:site-specific recombinase XerD
MPKPKLLDQIRSVIRFKHFSIRTEDSFIHWIKRFILFHNKRHPLEMSEQEIRQFLSHLAADENVAASTQNVALSAILFLYRDVLKKELRYINNIEWSKRPAKLPLIFT